MIHGIDSTTQSAQRLTGRESDRRQILAELRTSDTSAVVIVGMGGLGKSSLASELLARLEADGYIVVRLRDLVSVDAVLEAIGGKLVDLAHRAEWREDDPIRLAATDIRRTEIDVQRRMNLLTEAVLASRRIVVYFDRFEANIHINRISDPSLREMIESWLSSAGEGKLLFSSRVSFELTAVPSRSAIVEHRLGPLSADEIRTLVNRMPAFRSLGAKEVDRLGSSVNGDPLALQYLSACVQTNGGSVLEILDEVDLEHEQPDFETEALQIRKFLLQRYTQGLREWRPIAYDVLMGMAVFRHPVDELGLLWQISDIPVPDIAQDFVRELNSLAEEHGVDLSALAEGQWELVAPVTYQIVNEALRSSVSAHLQVPPGFGEAKTALVSSAILEEEQSAEVSSRRTYSLNAWTASALRADLEQEHSLVEAHRRAAEYYLWRYQALPINYAESLDDLIEARYHSLQSEDHSTAIALSSGAIQLLQSWGRWLQSASLIQETLELVDPDSSEAAWLLRAQGLAMEERGDYGAASRSYQESLSLAARIDDTSGIATSAHQLGNLAQLQGNYDEAEKYYAQSLAAKEGLGDRRSQAATLLNLGNLSQHRGDDRKAEERYVEALSVFEETGDRGAIATARQRLGSLAAQGGDFDRASKYFRNALEIFEDLGDRSGSALSLYNLGTVALRRGELDEALDLFRRTLRVAEDLGDVSSLAAIYHNLGVVNHQMGFLEDARRWYERSLTTEERLGDRAGIASSLHQLGLVAEDNGQDIEARDLFQQSLAIWEELGAKAAAARTLSQLGLLHAKRGEDEYALQLQLRALVSRIDIGSPEAALNLTWLDERRQDVGDSRFREELGVLLDEESVDRLLNAVAAEHQRNAKRPSGER